jgi:hypothetical protein
MRFIPKFNSTVYQVRVAVQYNGSGANRVNLSVYGVQTALRERY